MTRQSHQHVVAREFGGRRADRDVGGGELDGQTERPADNKRRHRTVGTNSCCHHEMACHLWVAPNCLGQRRRTQLEAARQAPHMPCRIALLGAGPTHRQDGEV
jgi:hypothetical protein